MTTRVSPHAARRTPASRTRRPGAVRTVGIALYGLGTVGSGVVEALEARRPELLRRFGLDLRLHHVVVRDPSLPRGVAVDPALVTTDRHAPLEDPAVDLVVEVMGGLDHAGDVVRAALRTGRGVVTANKALIATAGDELERLARAGGGRLRYEAAVGGAIPILHALRGALVANRIDRVRGIVNGTTNYILTRMAEDRLDLGAALADAQAKGFAEADPTADVSGLDAAQKLVILARHAFGRWPVLDRATVEGIGAVTPEAIEDAERRGRRIKLIAEAVRDGNDEPTLWVAPIELDRDEPLAAVQGVMNAIQVTGDFAGPLLFGGPGAGGRPTASAVVADIVELARSRRGR